MELNGDFDQRVVIDTAASPWLPCPQPGMQRKPLDRSGDAAARATSIVRHASGSAFPEDEHGLGQEFLVLNGLCSDECGSYPAGTYVRNPPDSHYRLISAAGCEIFLKLHQFQPDDQLGKVQRLQPQGSVEDCVFTHLRRRQSLVLEHGPQRTYDSIQRRGRHSATSFRLGTGDSL